MADIHYFNTEIAKLYGVNSAVLLQNIYFWIQKNKANGENEFDGNFWTYNSRKAFAEMFPYMNARQIDYALKRLIDDGVLVVGNYNKAAYDRTLWYAITKKGYSILQNCEMEVTKLSNGSYKIVKCNLQNCEMELTNLSNASDKIVTPIPDNKPNNKPNNKQSNGKPRFVPPTVDEIAKYCAERKNNIDPKTFFDYYEAAGWVDSKGEKVKNWKQKVITWERGNKRKTYGATGVEIKKPAVDDLAEIF